MRYINRKKIFLSLFILTLIVFSFTLKQQNTNNIKYFSDNKLYENEPKSSDYDPLWSYSTGTYRYIDHVAISSDGNYLVAQASHRIYFFNKNSSTPIWFNTQVWFARSVDISGDGKYIVVGDGGNNRIYLFERSSSTPLWTYTTGDEVWSVKISQDGNYIVAGSEDGKVYVFNRSNPIPLWTYSTGALVFKVSISENGTYIAAGGYNDRVYLFDKSSSTPLRIYYVNDAIHSLAISSDGNYIAAGTWLDHKIFLFDKFSSTPLWSYTAGADVRSISISSNGSYITAGSIDKKIYLFNITGPTPMWSYTTGSSVHSVVITPDGSKIFAGSDDRKIYMFNKFNSTPIWSYSSNLPIGTVDISTNGNYLVAGQGWNFNAEDVFNVYLFRELIAPDFFNLYTDADNPDDDGIFNLYWDASSGADNYSIFVSDTFITEIDGSCIEIASGITELTYPMSGLTSGIYYYVVVGYNQYGETISNCILIDVKIPPGLFNLYTNADNPDDDGLFNLYWDASSGADNYSIFVSDTFITEIDGSCIEIASGITELTYPMSGLTSGIYYYVVVGYNQYGEAISNCILIDVKIPPGLFNLYTNADNPDDDGLFNLYWDASSGADNYSLYVYDNYITEINISLTLFADQTAISPYPIIENSGTYYYLAIANNETGYTLSNCVSVNVQIPPGVFTLTSDADIPDLDGSFNLIWTDSNHADNYSIYVYNNYITEINNSLTLLADQTAISPYLISGLPNGTYYYAIVAFNEYGNFTSNCISIGVKLFPPGIFTLTSDADTPDRDGIFNLIWTDSNHADNYSIYVSDNHISEINSSLTILTDQSAISPYPIIENSGTYFYVVIAFNEYGNFTSNCISINIQIPPGILTLTTDADTPDTDGIFNLIWTGSNRAENYSIYFYNNYISEINSSLTILTDQSAISPYPIIENSGTYFYVVIAFNEYGNFTSNCISINIQIPPGIFTLTTDADTLDTDGSFNLIWTDSNHGDNYSLYLYDSYITEINNSLTLLADQIAVSPYSISGLTNGTYYYVVVAFNEYENFTSNCISINIKLFPPGSFTLSSDADTPDTDGSFNLIWTDSNHGDNYSLYLYDSYITEINNSLTLLADQSVLSPYSISGLTNGTYYFVIVAFNKFGETISNCIKITVELPISPPLPPDDDDPNQGARVIQGYNIVLSLFAIISISICFLLKKYKKLI